MTISFGPRTSHEFNAAINHSPVRGVEVIHPKEEPDPSGHLIPDNRTLLITVGAGEQQSGLGPRRPDDYPSLRATVVRQGRRVLHEVEVKNIDKEFDGLVVVIDHEGDKINPHLARIGPARTRRQGRKGVIRLCPTGFAAVSSSTVQDGDALQ